MLKILRRVLSTILGYDSRSSWKKIEYFNLAWRKRIELMAQFISEGESILDLGCGQMWLRDYISETCVYIPVDYKNRGEGTLICDFNKGQFPELKVDIGFVSGCFEYIIDYSQFVRSIERFCGRVVISYVSTDLEPDLYKRKKNGWRNHLSRSQFLRVFVRSGFILDKAMTDGKFVVYHFVKH